MYLGMAATVTLNLLQGQTFRRTFVLSRTDSNGASEPLPTIGCTGVMQIRNRYGEPVLLELTTENGGITVDPDTDGRVEVYISDEQTDALGLTDDPLKPRAKFMYDLELVYPNGDVLRVMESDACTIKRNITRVEP